VAIDAEGRIAVWNEGARRILGSPAAGASLLGRDCREALAGRPRLAQLLLETLACGSGLSRAELSLGEDPAATTLGLSLAPVRDPAARVRGAALWFRDLAPIERRDEQERLRDRLAALGEMAAGLAHEIRNPLAGMEVLVGLLRRRLADRPAEQELLAELTGELRAVADTVREGLDFVRPVAPAPALVDPVAAFEGALAAARARVPFAGAVERDFAPGLPPLRADPEQLRVLLANLLLNALEAIAEAGGGAQARLGLSLHARGPDAGELEFTVRDSGRGVPAELREKIFYPFFSTKQRGSGLGLALAQKIALSHGGSLERVDEARAGAVFRLRLPVGEEP
jgi:signal transduction histidine kinase